MKYGFLMKIQEIQALYKEYLKEPLSHKAEALLHTDHTSWEVPTMYEQIR